MAATAWGEGPNRLSFAPSRAAKRCPRARSCASGPTKGTVEGSDAARGVKRGPVMPQTQAEIPSGGKRDQIWLSCQGWRLSRRATFCRTGFTRADHARCASRWHRFPRSKGSRADERLRSSGRPGSGRIWTPRCLACLPKGAALTGAAALAGQAPQRTASMARQAVAGRNLPVWPVAAASLP